MALQKKDFIKCPTISVDENVDAQLIRLIMGVEWLVPSSIYEKFKCNLCNFFWSDNPKMQMKILMS